MKIVFCICISLCFAVAELKKCTLPKGQNVHWNELHGKWYEVLNAHTPGDKLVKCFNVQFTQTSADQVIMLTRDEHLSTHRYSSIPIFIKIIRPGIGVWKKSSMKKWISSLIEDSDHHNIGKTVMQQLKTMYRIPKAFYTDYRTYSMSISCGMKHERFIWANTPTPYPSAESLINIFNKLVELGDGWNDVPLYLSGCTDHPRVKYFRKE